MVESMIKSNCEIILRDPDLEDHGEIGHYNAFKCTMRLNDISSWQLDMHTSDFLGYDIDIDYGIIFKRDGVLMMSGPVTDIQHTLTEGEQKSVVYGACDLDYLMRRVCYPIVEGPIFENGAWYFKKKRNAESIWSLCTVGDSGKYTLTLENAFGFVAGNTAEAVNNLGTHLSLGTITSVDWSTNTITMLAPIAVDWLVGAQIVQHGSGIVDDPAFTGYDVRSGPAETVAKQIVYYNAGEGSCTDHFGPRAIPYLICADDLGRGTVTTANSRGEYVFDQVRDICLAGGLNIKCEQIGGSLVFDVFKGNDLSINDNLVFRRELGNLTDYDYTRSPPKMNFVMGSGPGTGTDKMMLPSGNIDNIAEFGRREGWVNAGTAQAGDTTEQINANMVQSNNLALAAALVNAQLTISIQETPSVLYPRDFKVGDIAAVYIGNTKFSIPIGAVDYSIPASTGGATGSAVTAALMRQPSKQMLQQNAMNKTLQTVVRS
jgi:hypothetical protein